MWIEPHAPLYDHPSHVIVGLCYHNDNKLTQAMIIEVIPNDIVRYAALLNDRVLFVDENWLMSHTIVVEIITKEIQST